MRTDDVRLKPASYPRVYTRRIRFYLRPVAQAEADTQTAVMTRSTTWQRAHVFAPRGPFFAPSAASLPPASAASRPSGLARKSAPRFTATADRAHCASSARACRSEAWSVGGIRMYVELPSRRVASDFLPEKSLNVPVVQKSGKSVPVSPASRHHPSNPSESATHRRDMLRDVPSASQMVSFRVVLQTAIGRRRPMAVVDE